jgi:hypothetical protein
MKYICLGYLGPGDFETCLKPWRDASISETGANDE